MGAGGVSGELRDHSEHVEAIIRTHFNVANGQTASFSQSSSNRTSQPSASSFNFPEDDFEEMVCFSCSSNFTIFRRKNLCWNCKRHYCNDCFAKEIKFVPSENIRHCLACRALQNPIAYKDHLNKLKVKDLQGYLRSREISMNHCKEKTDLIELILRHAEGRPNTAHSTSHSQQGRQQTQANPINPQSQSNWQPRSSTVYPPPNTQLVQVPPSALQPSVCKSLSQIQNIDEVEELSVKELKRILTANFVDFKGCCEKTELLDRVRTLWKSKQEMIKKKSSMAPGEEDDFEEQCKICMDASIDCVLLECGHMVTCTTCGKQITDCPICRQHISRIVHVFKA